MSEHRRWRLDIGYDGTDFHGWAAQDDLRTVQGELEHWITTTLRLPEAAVLTVAGRTDAGVHARGQVAHVDLPVEIEGELLKRRLDRVLPPDVLVRAVVPAPAGFDARFAASWRRYCYRIWDAESMPDPILRRQIATVRGSLDVDAMTDAAAGMLGLHDFAAFCKRREGATTIRKLTQASVVRAADANRTVEVHLMADAFCHSMVRSIVGALVAVGQGRRDRSWIEGLLQLTERSGQFTVMPASGLTLEEVGYPADDELAARASAARNVRELMPDDLPCTCDEDES